MYPLVSCGGETDSDSTYGASPRALVQRQRVDPGSKSSSLEPSYWLSFSYRHLASRFTGLLGEQIRVPRLICSPNCMSRKHLSRESTGSQYRGKRVFFQRGLDNGESWELFCKHTEGLQSALVIWTILCYSGSSPSCPMSGNCSWGLTFRSSMVDSSMMRRHLGFIHGLGWIMCFVKG